MDTLTFFLHYYCPGLHPRFSAGSRTSSLYSIPLSQPSTPLLVFHSYRPTHTKPQAQHRIHLACGDERQKREKRERRGWKGELRTKEEER